MIIREWTRRIGMGRYKYTLSYDSRDQENAAVCGILAALGNKRSAVIRALLMDAVRRYGTDVFSKENVKVLLYLIEHAEMTGDTQRAPSKAENRMEPGFTFPEEKPGKKRKITVRKQTRIASDSSKNLEYEGEPEQGMKTVDTGMETASEDSAGTSEKDDGSGSGTLMDFLQVKMFEGQ